MPSLNGCLSGLACLRLTSDLMRGDIRSLVNHELRNAEFGDDELGLLLENLGDLAFAMAMHEEALRGQEAWLGTSHKQNILDTGSH